MESENDGAALAAAEAARDRLAGEVQVPRWQDESIAAAVAVQIATTALVPAVDEAWARWALVGGVVLFGLVAWLALWRFSRLNGVRIGGFASRVVFGTTSTASFGYAVALVIAFVAALRDLWWLVAVAAIAGGLAYVLGGRRWLRAYRQQPARLGPGESALWLALLLALALAGLVLLVIER